MSIIAWIVLGLVAGLIAEKLTGNGPAGSSRVSPGRPDMRHGDVDAPRRASDHDEDSPPGLHTEGAAPAQVRFPLPYRHLRPGRPDNRACAR
ncbi:hypothetical protein FRACA_260004 [Frankia canadensis]|uniref:Uncharacterized protein n=1 Tax=Frankia canadensis TaxID=1836972 RepID=A0A2I2KSA4_9ACTN|nr:hypothetical protein FRACA_260004 [Frankia canadensis]SOU55841.1 hypothetical protein FRACA_260004 [Frankia canadensis]